MPMPQPRLSTSGYFDREFNTRAVKILPGEFYATADGTAIATLLGSCVSVCLYDKKKGVGGMNHFMLPQLLLDGGRVRCSPPHTSSCNNPCSTRYGECAFKRILAELATLGAVSLEAKLFGAGRVMAGVTDIGGKNAAFALGYLRERNIPVVAADLGECCPRKVFFFPATGQAFVKRLTMKPQGIC